MEHTWQSDHLPKLEVANLEAGDVAVCGSFAEGAPILSEVDPDRVGFVAPLGSRSDLEWLLRGLHLHPNIRHLVICGDDQRLTGEALLALWQEGLDEGGRLPGSRGSLSPELDAPSMDALRGYVQVSDWRSRPLAEVASNICHLPALSRGREPRALPNPEIPERVVFHSRKSTFPIFSSGVGDAWLQLLNLALRIGEEKQTAGGERMAEALNAVVTIESPTLEDGGKQVEEEFPDFLDFNRDDFDRLYFPCYDERLHNWDGIDQLEAVCDRLKKSRDTRSGTMVFLEPNDMAKSKVGSGVISATFNAVDQQLCASFVLRSEDLYTDWPLEATALIRLQREVADRTRLEAGAATFVIHSAHLYERDWDRALRVLKESFKRPLPLQVDPSGIFLFGNDGGKATAMLLDHSASTIFWEEGFSDPEDLSWYIVDVMPWLLPQHIRYVGQECASLMRAIREGECYEQG
jgi:thymidylate synthase